MHTTKFINRKIEGRKQTLAPVHYSACNAKHLLSNGLDHPNKAFIDLLKKNSQTIRMSEIPLVTKLIVS